MVEVCRRLDGIPLALELAATRVRLLSVEEIAARLDDRFRLLTAGSRTAPPRQQPLRATLDWSYALLLQPDQTLFHRLSVFAGSWTLAAAEAICAGEMIESSEVLDVLGHLVDQSLVVAEEQADQVRYRLLETMRQYAAEKLADAGESVTVSGRRRDWFLAQAEGSLFELQDPQHVDWLADELDNLRAALRWSIQWGEVEAGLRLAVRVSTYWHQRGFYTEGRAWFARCSSSQEPRRRPWRGPWPLARAAALAILQADFPSAERLSDQALQVARRIRDPRTTAMALQTRAIIAAGTWPARARVSRRRCASVERTATRRWASITCSCWRWPRWRAATWRRPGRSVKKRWRWPGLLATCGASQARCRSSGGSALVVVSPRTAGCCSRRACGGIATTRIGTARR
jgi:hypothetical protein